MNKMILLGAVVSVAGIATTATGCAYRDAKMWNDDIQKVVEPKKPDMKACYDGVLRSDPKAAGKVAIAFEVETDGGKLQNVTVDKAKTTAPAPVQECVTKNLQGLSVNPPDKRLGQGTIEFDFQPGAPGKS